MKRIIIYCLMLTLLLVSSARAANDSAACSAKEPAAPEALKVILNKADDLIKKKRFEQALLLLEKNSRKYKHHLLFFLWGLADYRLEKNAEAEKYFRQAVEIYPCFGPAWQNLAVINYSRGKKELAARQAEKAYTLIKPENPELLYQAAVFWLESSAPEKALPHLETLAEHKKVQGEWLMALAGAYSDQKQPEKAAEVFIKASGQIKSRRNELRYNAALCYLKADRPEKALPLLQKLIKGRKVESPWLLACVNTLNQLKKHDEAARIMERLSKQSQDKQGENLFKAAKMWLEADQADRAVNLLEELVDQEKPCAVWLQTLIQTYLDLNKLQEAENILDKLLAIEPDRKEFWDLAVWLAMEKKEYQRAAAALEVTHRLKAPEADSLKRLGDLYLKSGVPARAAETYARAFASNPGPGELDILAKTYLAAHELELAAQKAAQAAALAPDAARWTLLGDINLKRRDLAQALAAYKKAAELNDPDGLNSLKAAKIALRLEKLETAEKSFQQVINRAGQDSPAGMEASNGLLTIAKLKQEES